MFSMNAFLLRRVAVGVAFFALLFQKNSHAQSTNTRPGLVAAKPLFRDPLHDGPTDPTVIWNRAEQKWFMFYTSRRANMTNSANGVEWVHGCQIGIAESTNAGAAWSYRGTANIAVGDSNATYWAPEIVEANGGYHMMLTLVPGIFSDWNHPRSLLHLTSSNLLDWKYVSTLALASDRLIDPCLARLPDGHWRLWYNNERDKKSIYYADSADLFAWTDKGKCPGTNERGGEGPKVFRWNNYWWMIKDIWRGLRVYRSDDTEHWQMQTNDILATPGRGADDADIGRHCDVVVSGERAFLFYFTHPEHDSKTPASRRSSIQVVELEFKDGVITCDRDEPTHINLQPPALPLSEARYKIGVSDLMILKRQKLGAFPLARTLNADGVEVDMGGLGERETFDNALTNAATREQFLAKARELGLAIPSVAMTGFFAQSFADRPTVPRIVADTIATMKELGVKVAFLPLGVKGDLLKNPELRPAIVERLRAAGKQAEAAGVVIAVETSLPAADEVKLLDEIGSSAVKIYFNFASAIKNHRDLVGEIRTLGQDRIAQIHCTNEDGVWLENDATIDLAHVKQTLDDLGWRGWLVAERSRDATDPRNVKKNFGANVAFLKKVFQPTQQSSTNR